MNCSIDRASFGVLKVFHKNCRSGAGFSVSLPNWNYRNLTNQTKNLAWRNRQAVHSFSDSIRNGIRNRCRRRDGYRFPDSDDTALRHILKNDINVGNIGSSR